MGRRAVDSAALSGPDNCREYLTLRHRPGVGGGDRLLDVACGAGPATEFARLRGAGCAGCAGVPGCRGAGVPGCRCSLRGTQAAPCPAMDGTAG